MMGALFVERGAWAVLVAPPHKAHLGSDWLGLLDEIEQGRWAALYYAFVRMFRTPTDYVTCGMGSMGQRDFVLTKDVAADEAFRLLDHLAKWAICEQPEHKPGGIIGDGRGGHLVLQPEPCAHYAADSDEFNPLGIWRLVPI